MNKIKQTIALYQRMPGAPMPPYEPDRGYLWGEVDGNEHWEFCAAIVDQIHAVAADLGNRGLVDLADDLRLVGRQ